MFRAAFVLLILGLAAPVVNAQIYKWTDEQGHVHYGERPPAGQATTQIAAPPSAGSAAQSQSGGIGRIPLSNLPTLPPEEAERRRRIVEQMDAEREAKERAAFRDSDQGRLACGMLQAQLRDAESGVLRGHQGETRLTPAQQSQIVPALREQYERSCR